MTTDAGDVVTVRVRVRWPHRQQREAWFCGRLLVRREVWDKPPVLGEGVRWVSGSWPVYAGSAACPQLGFDGVVVLEVDGVRRADLADLGPWEGDVVVLDDADALRREAVVRETLLAERDRLLMRVADIDAILGDDGADPDLGGLDDDDDDD